MGSGGRQGRVTGAEEPREHEERRIARSYMVARAAALIPMAVITQLGDDRIDALWYATLAVCLVTGTAGIALAFSASWRRVSPAGSVPFDVLAFGALIATSGGAQSDLRWFVVAAMVAPAIILPPRTVGLAGAGLLAIYAASALPDLLQGEAQAGQDAITYATGMVWVTAAAALLSAIRTTNEERVRDLTRSQQRLLGAILDTDERARRRITTDLHEGPLQHLLAARQDLEEARTGDTAALVAGERGIVSAVALLRSAIADVRPVALDHGGLGAGLRAVAERAARGGGFAATVMVEPAAEGLRDDVIVPVVRALVENVAEHARAAHLEVRLARRDGALLLDVRDDGLGFDPAAALDDEVGLAACAERVRAAGGDLRLTSAPGEGTSVSIRLPV